MNKHRKKCEHLKQIRKNMADSLGVDLKQTVCTYEGECSGTCPKCQQEEKVLSKALLAGSAVVGAAIMLTGCTVGPFVTEGALEAPAPWEDEMIDGGMTGPEDYDDIQGGEDWNPDFEIEEYPLEGDVAYTGEEIEE